MGKHGILSTLREKDEETENIRWVNMALYLNMENMENRLREKDEEIENIRWVNMAFYQH